MALTKEEKRNLSKEIGDYMRKGYTKKEAEIVLRLWEKGFDV
jgi:hypothetical protein